MNAINQIDLRVNPEGRAIPLAQSAFTRNGRSPLDSRVDCCAMRFSEHGVMIQAVRSDNTLIVFGHDRETRRITNVPHVSAMEFSKDRGQMFLNIISEDGLMRVDVSSNATPQQSMTPFQMNFKPVPYFAMSRDYKNFFFATAQGKVFESRLGQYGKTPIATFTRGITCIAKNQEPRSRLIAVGLSNGSIGICSHARLPKTRVRVFRLDDQRGDFVTESQENPVTALTFESKKRLFVGFQSGHLARVNLETKTVVFHHEQDEDRRERGGPVKALAWNPKNKQLFRVTQYC